MFDLKALPVPEPSPDLTSRIVRQLVAQKPAQPVPVAWLVLRRTALALAACVVLALAGLLGSACSGATPTGVYSVHDYWGDRMTRLLRDPLDVINKIVKGVHAG